MTVKTVYVIPLGSEGGKIEFALTGKGGVKQFYPYRSYWKLLPIWRWILFQKEKRKMVDHVQEMNRDELVCIMGALDFAIYAGEKSMKNMTEGEKATLEILKSAFNKTSALLGLSPESLAQIQEKTKKRFDK